MARMRAIVFGDDRTIRLEEVPVPEVGPGHVLLRPHFCGVCGTDLHAPSMTAPFRSGVVMGHEFSGEVVATGEQVRGWEPGTRVVVNPNGNLCGACGACRDARFNLCRSAVMENGIGIRHDGGMAEFVTVDPRVLHRLPDAVSSEQGAFVEPLATALRAVRRSRFRLGSSAAVIGTGPVGLLVVQALRRAGAATITALELSAFRRQAAGDLGADLARDPEPAPPTALFGTELEPPEFVFECSGAQGTLELAVDIVRYGGRVALTGLPSRPVEVTATTVIGKEVEVVGSIIYVEEFPLAIDLLAKGAFDIESLTSLVLPITRFEEAFDALADPVSTLKVLLHPTQS
ncbi:MAG: alcohol dehydrogenase catalytic domain-containing protein [Acidimicrobiia bacterium]|nr:alcohol dehydrogenase catalytic domain-containing protein [Acidimicrobiia bacterium]